MSKIDITAPGYKVESVRLIDEHSRYTIERHTTETVLPNGNRIVYHDTITLNHPMLISLAKKD